MAITAADYVPAGQLPGIGQGTDRGQFLRTRNERLLETIIIPMPNSVADEAHCQVILCEGRAPKKKPDANALLLSHPHAANSDDPTLASLP